MRELLVSEIVPRPSSSERGTGTRPSGPTSGGASGTLPSKASGQDVATSGAAGHDSSCCVVPPLAPAPPLPELPPDAPPEPPVSVAAPPLAAPPSFPGAPEAFEPPHARVSDSALSKPQAPD